LTTKRLRRPATTSLHVTHDRSRSRAGHKRFFLRSQ
jgi:hypothetical protein